MNSLYLAMPGTSELIIIFFIVLILFGANKVPKIMGNFAKGIKNFKKELDEDVEKIDKKE